VFFSLKAEATNSKIYIDASCQTDDPYQIDTNDDETVSDSSVGEKKACGSDKQDISQVKIFVNYEAHETSEKLGVRILTYQYI